MAKGAERAGRTAPPRPSAKDAAKERSALGRSVGGRTPRGKAPAGRRRPPDAGIRRDELELRAEAAETAARELESSRQSYADVFDLAPIAYATLDRRGIVHEINLAGATLLGRYRSSLLGRPLRLSVVPSDRLKLLGHLSRCHSEATTVSTEVRLLGADRREVVVQLTSRRFVDLEGHIRLLTTLHDLTLRKRAEAAIHRQFEVLEGVNRILAAGLVASTEEGLGRDCLSVAEQITGSQYGFIGEIYPDGLLHAVAVSDPSWNAGWVADPAAEGRPPGPPRARGLFGRVLQDGEGFFTNDPASDLDGIAPPAGFPPLTAFLGVPLRRETRILGLVAVGKRSGEYRQEHLRVLEALTPAMVEAFARKRGERQLFETNQRLGALLNSLPVGVSFSEGPSSERITGNPALLAQFEMRPGDNVSASAPDPHALGRRIRFSVNGRELNAAELPLQRAVAERRVIPPMELEIQMPGGRRWIAETSGAPVLDEQGRVMGGIAVTVDITARKQAEDLLRHHKVWDDAKVAIGKAAVSGESLEGILQTGLDAVAHAAGAPVGMIRLVDPETRNLVLIAGRNLLPAYRQEAARTRWGEYLAGRVAATGRLQVVEDVSEEPSLSLLARLTDPPISSLIGIPLQAEGQVVGTLALGHPQPRHFNAAAADELLSTASMLAGAIRAEQLREALRREAGARALLLRELNHRVRNNLAALIGLLHLTAEKLEGPASASLNAVAERVGHLADLHEMMSARGGEAANLRELVELAARGALVPAAEEPAVCWKVDGVDVRIPPTQVIPVTLVLHELFNNCAKHAFHGRPAGRVAVAIHRIGGDVCLEVSDDGPGPGPGSGGLGLSIAEALVTETLHGSFHLVAARDGGALACVRLPLRAELQT